MTIFYMTGLQNNYYNNNLPVKDNSSTLSTMLLVLASKELHYFVISYKSLYIVLCKSIV